MSVQVQGPDGQTYQFPDGTDKAAAIAYFKKKGIGVPPPPSPPNSVTGGVGRRAVDILKGLKQTFSPPKSTLDYFAGPALPLLRMGEGAVQSGIAAGKQAVQQAKEAHSIAPGNKALKTLGYAHAFTTGLAALDPFASGTVTNVNDLEAQGRSREAAGQALPDLALLLAPEAAKGAAKVLPKVARAATKTGPGETAALVKETRASNEADVKAASEANTKAASEHLEKTQEALHKTEGAELKYQQETAQAQQAAEAEDRANLKKHLEGREAAIRERAEVEQKLIAKKAAQGKIEPTQAKLQTAWSNLRAGIETARERALKVGNEKYSAVNEKLNPLPADMEKIHGAYYEAAESLGEAQAQPTILTGLGKALNQGAEFTYKDEQQLYSSLGKELSKGTLLGPPYHALDMLHDAIGEDMQRIADANGQGAELTEARNYWRRMKQTFGKPLAMNDAATKALKGSASGQAAEDAAANHIRLLGSFDPDIPKLFNHIANIEKGANALPKPISARELEQGTRAPAIPPRKPVLPRAEPKPVAPPERMAPPDRPAEVLPQTRTIGAEDIRKAKEESLAAREKKARTGYSPFLSAISVFDAIRNGMEGNWSKVALDLGARGAYEVGKQGFAALLRNPRVIEMLTKPTPADLAQIPPDLRGKLGPLLDEAKRQNIKVSPAFLSAAGVVPLRPRHPVFSAQSPIQ